MPFGLGAVATDHAVPFHCSTNVVGGSVELVDELPTATQLVGLAQETPFNPPLPVGFGLAMIDQLVPFHCSTNGTVTEPEVEVPTATQLVGLGHDTPFNAFDDAPSTVGLGRADQLIPSHCSANVALPEAVETWPTATQLMALEHATPLIVAVVGEGGTIIDTTDQPVPFQNWEVSRLLTSAPTATQLVAARARHAVQVPARRSARARARLDRPRRTRTRGRRNQDEHPGHQSYGDQQPDERVADRVPTAHTASPCPTPDRTGRYGGTGKSSKIGEALLQQMLRYARNEPDLIAHVLQEILVVVGDRAFDLITARGE